MATIAVEGYDAGVVTTPTTPTIGPRLSVAIA